MPDETTAGPTVLVRVRYAAGGYAAEIRVAADAEAAAAATAEGFIAVEVPSSPFPPFPKWLYHPDGPRRIVATQDEQDALGGDWGETAFEPVAPVEAPPAEPPAP